MVEEFTADEKRFVRWLHSLSDRQRTILLWLVRLKLANHVPVRVLRWIFKDKLHDPARVTLTSSGDDFPIIR